MLENIDIWRFAAGLGLFLFGMTQLENGVKELAGRRFKVFIKKHTKNKIKAIFGGTLITAVLQSSSVVSLMLLAFVGAGVISMQNALGVILGSNLGTTFTGWLVATLGFKMNIEDFVIPFIAIGSLMVVLFPKQKSFFNSGLLIVGLAFVFLGLDFMKNSIQDLAENFDVSAFAEYGPIVFLFVGFIFTAIIQSSSASMVITLSALNAGIIDFHSGAAMVIGADLGTTITVLLGGITGTSSKKRVALGHFLFNLVTDLIAFMMLNLIILFIIDVLGITDKLFGLVIFHSLFNVLGIIIFYPFIDRFAKFLTQRYTKESDLVGKFIHDSTSELPEAGIQALGNETKHLIILVVQLQIAAFRIETSDQPKETKNRHANWLPKISGEFKDGYHRIKQLEGEMINFYGELQKEQLTEEESSRLALLMAATRNALHAAKEIKDIETNLSAFRRSSRSVLNKLYHGFSEFNQTMNERFVNILASKNEMTNFEELAHLMIEIQKNYDSLLGTVYERPIRRHLDEIEISTVLNVNRELYSSNKGITLALKDYLLTPEQALEFENLPTFR